MARRVLERLPVSDSRVVPKSTRRMATRTRRRPGAAPGVAVGVHVDYGYGWVAGADVADVRRPMRVFDESATAEYRISFHDMIIENHNILDIPCGL